MLKRIILSASLIGLTLTLAPAPDASANWGTYQYDAQHTGKAPVKGPSIPNIKWQYLAGQQVYADPNDPNNLWTEGFGFTAGITEGPDGTIYAPGDDGRGYAFDPRTGAVKHIFENVGVCCASPVVGKDGSIYFSGNGLWAFNPDYSLKFYYPDGGNCCGAITVADDGTIIVGNGWLHAFDPANLVYLDPTNPDPTLAKVVAPKWIYNEKEAGWSAAVTVDGNTVYAMNRAELIAIDPNNLILAEDGKYYAATKWSVPVTNDFETMPLIDAYGTVYISSDQQLVAVNPMNQSVRTVASIPGQQIANISINGGTIMAVSVPIVVDLVAGTRTFDQDGDSTLYAINAASGAINWSAPLAGSGESHVNPIIDNTGAVYVNTAQKADGVDYYNNLYMFSSAGTPVWTYSKGTTLSSDTRCPIIGMDGTLYALIDGAIVAFGGTADLSPAIVATPSPVNTNADLSFTTTVSNAGPDKSAATIVKITLPSGFSGSSNFVFPANCILNGSRSLSCELGEIPVGGTAPVTVTGKAKATVGSMSITATTRSDVPDPVTTNNSKTISVSVIAPPPPTSCDLVVTAAPTITSTSSTTPRTSINKGTNYNFKATVKNQGTGSCAASTIAFYLSSDASIPTGDYRIGTTAVTSLAAGASKSVTLTTNVPLSVTSTTYYYGAFADYNSVVAETNETNNTKVTSTKSITVQ